VPPLTETSRLRRISNTLGTNRFGIRHRDHDLHTVIQDAHYVEILTLAADTLRFYGFDFSYAMCRVHSQIADFKHTTSKLQRKKGKEAKPTNFIITRDICKELIRGWEGLSEELNDIVKDAE
jgi:hypothetical protein